MKYLNEVPKALLGCSVDPLTIAVGAASLFGGLFAGSKAGGASPAAPTAPAAQTPPQAPPTTSPIAPKSSQPSFISSTAVPPASSGSGGKSLLGQ